MTRVTRPFLLIAALLALAVRLVVPAGYMPERTADGWTLDICTGHGPMKIALGDKPTKPGPSEASTVCAFAGMAAPLLPALPVALLAVMLFVALGQVRPRSELAPVLPRRRLRPPLRGPPSF